MIRMDKKQRKEYMRKYRQSEAYKIYQKKYRQGDTYKKYRNSDAFKMLNKKNMQRYRQSEAFKKYQERYRQSDTYKRNMQRYQEKYRQSDAYRNKRTISTILSYYQRHLLKTQEELKKYAVVPLPLKAKEAMERDLINNLKLLRKYTSTNKSKLKPYMVDKLITMLVNQEWRFVYKDNKFVIQRWSSATNSAITSDTHFKP